MHPLPGYRDAPLTQFPTEPTDPDEAEEFLRRLYHEQPKLVEGGRGLEPRVDLVREQIADHHTESRRFLAHIETEESAGRSVPADWTWIVPPMSGAATPVFHRYYAERDQRPNFYLDEAARDLSRCPFHASGSAAVPDAAAARTPTGSAP